VRSKRVPLRWKVASAARSGAQTHYGGDPRLVDTLEEMIDHQTRGDPASALRWICKSTRAIAKELGRHKHPVSHAKVAQLLHGLHYSLQSNRKTEEGRDHPTATRNFGTSMPR